MLLPPLTDRVQYIPKEKNRKRRARLSASNDEGRCYFLVWLPGCDEPEEEEQKMSRAADGFKRGRTLLFPRLTNQVR